MWKDLFGLAFNLIPPTDADPEHVRKYHITLSLWILAMTIGGGLHIAMACGFMTMFFPGFATAGQWNMQEQALAQQQRQINGLELANFGAQLFTMREKQCKAPSGSKDVYTNQLNALYDNYVALAKQAPRLPGCEEF